MLKRFFFILSVAGVLVGCDKRETMKLTLQVDSLRQELVTSQQAANTLQEVGTLIDSIDASRHLLRTNMVEGTSYDNYLARMNDINSYVKETENKIRELEKASKKSSSTASSYAATIKKLKKDLEKTNQEMIALQETVSKYRAENDNLALTVGLRDAEIRDKEEQIKLNQQELLTMETRVEELMVQSKVDEAESYFARAQLVEETAKRTKFAPRKRRATRQQALELYKMSLFLGKEEAQPKIAQLEDKL